MGRDFAALLRRLVDGQVDFVVVGGIACALIETKRNIHRANDEIDILVLRRILTGQGPEP